MKRENEELFLEAKSAYEELGYRNYRELETKANLVLEISKVIRKNRLTQAQCAEILGISQPKMSELLNGRFRGYSVERLMHFLNALGQDVDIVVRERPQTRSARVTVLGGTKRAVL
jgi:predicted XRE-type DNA-binding protein